MQAYVLGVFPHVRLPPAGFLLSPPNPARRWDNHPAGVSWPHPVQVEGGRMTSPSPVLTGRLVEPINDEDHIRGPVAAPVTLLEYGDYECPYCAAAHPVVQEALRLRPDTLRYVYRHFPLTNVHPYAEPAAQAAEAATVRQRFWPMHDWLLVHQDRLDPAGLRTAAEWVGLPPVTLEQEVAGHAHLERIRRDLVGGIRSGVTGTPAFFVNGARLTGGYALPNLLAAVDAAAP
jgi:protein-disulfide isomerase